MSYLLTLNGVIILGITSYKLYIQIEFAVENYASKIWLSFPSFWYCNKQ